jgi:hypothetical protein
MESPDGGGVILTAAFTRKQPRVNVSADVFGLACEQMAKSAHA